MRGARVPDGAGLSPDLWWPGDYGKRRISYDTEEFDAWWVCTPNGLLGRLLMPQDAVAGRSNGAHYVIEHSNGAITVTVPRPGQANSILIEGYNGTEMTSWHGYIERGVWRSC